MKNVWEMSFSTYLSNTALHLQKQQLIHTPGTFKYILHEKQSFLAHIHETCLKFLALPDALLAGRRLYYE